MADRIRLNPNDGTPMSLNEMCNASLKRISKRTNAGESPRRRRMHGARIFSRLLARAVTALLPLFVLTACGKSAPTYSGVSLMYQNYLPYNLSRFTITDAYGNKASGGADSAPGGGGGTLSCCYKLKGTEFTVKWNYYDIAQSLRGDHRMLHAEAKVSMPPSLVPEDIGTRIFEVHFFPDRHVEFQFPGGLLDDSRVPIVEVSRWMSNHYQEELDRKFDDNWAESHRRISRVVAAAWLKYRLTDQADLNQYVYLSLLVNDQFDAHPEVQRILQERKGTPGQFAKAMQALPRNVMGELTGNRFTPASVPAIPDGLLPPPRTEEKQHG